MGLEQIKSYVNIWKTSRALNGKKFYNKGFSLVELIVVLAIIVILSAVAVPSFSGYMEKTKKNICRVNCLQLERMYGGYLVTEGIEHSDAVFIEYLQKYGQNICPDNGDITYVQGKVQCSLHPRGEDRESGEDVPFLMIWIEW